MRDGEAGGCCVRKHRASGPKTLTCLQRVPEGLLCRAAHDPRRLSRGLRRRKDQEEPIVVRIPLGLIRVSGWENVAPGKPDHVTVPGRVVIDSVRSLVSRAGNVAAIDQRMRRINHGHKAIQSCEPNRMNVEYVGIPQKPP